MNEQLALNRDRVTPARRKFIYTALFLVWPLGTAIASLKYYREPMAKNIFWLFCIFFGFTFIVDTDQMADSVRYVELFTDYSRSNITVRDLVDDLYSRNTLQLDIAQPLITFMVARVTRNPIFLFATFAFIFGFFYSRNLWYVMERIPGRRDFFVVALLVVLALLNPIWNINNFRFYTAFQIFFYGAIRFLMEGRYKFIAVALLSALVHFTFIIPVLILAGFSFLPRKIPIYFWLFIATGFIKEINLLIVRDLIYLLPDIFFFRVQSYTAVDYAESLEVARSFTNWYVTLSSKSVVWVSYALMIYLFITKRRRISENKELVNLLCFSLLLFAFGNVASLVPSGGRFLVLANALLMASLILVFASDPPNLITRMVQLAALPLILLFVVVSVRVGMDFTGLMLLVGNPAFLAVIDDPLPLIEYLK